MKLQLERQTISYCVTIGLQALHWHHMVWKFSVNRFANLLEEEVSGVKTRDNHY